MTLAKMVRRFGLAPFLKGVNQQIRRLSERSHKLEFDAVYGIQPIPEWFDHFLDQHYHWPATGIPFSWERGIFNLLAMQQGCRVLNLCCGSGFYDRHFYAVRAGEIVAVDFDPEAVRHARRYNSVPNVRFEICDIRRDLPSGHFDNILWDGAIEHFTEAEITDIVSRLKPHLAPNGILSGYTIVERQTGKSHVEHEYEFKSKEDLSRFFVSFKNTRIFETVYPTRHNLYFFTSDGPLPF
jgi:SAM-dependent methyltransferase